MAFKINTSQQLSLDDSFISLTAREKKALENSWAQIFADEIFPAIDEERFSVLYSDKTSRPNTPVNVIIGALIIKELFDYSDDDWSYVKKKYKLNVINFHIRQQDLACYL